MTMRDRKNILIVDDSRVVCKIIESFLTKNSYKVEVASSVSEASRVIGHTDVGVVLIDYELSGINEGSVLIEKIKKYGFDLKIFAISSSDSSNEKMRNSGADGFLSKDPKLILKTLNSIID
jgi:CheY-like chemotaxis protein